MNELNIKINPEKKLARDDAKWKCAADVDWSDLQHFINVCRQKQDKESFDTALQILKTLKKQVLER